MNKKILIVALIVIVILISLIVFLNRDTNTIDPDTPSTNVDNTDENKTVEVTNEEQIEQIKNNSYLNILLQIKTFDSLNISYEPLLEAAMRIAKELNLYQTPDNGTYIEYVPREIVHELIYELSGIKIEKPIVIEDFYYLYDANEDYYYVVPIGSNWLELTKVNSIHTSNSDQYIIKCSAESISDYSIKTTYPNIELRLKYKPANTYIKYQLISIKSGAPTIEAIQTDEDNYYEENIFNSGDSSTDNNYSEENIFASGDIPNNNYSEDTSGDSRNIFSSENT